MIIIHGTKILATMLFTPRHTAYKLARAQEFLNLHPYGIYHRKKKQNTDAPTVNDLGANHCAVDFVQKYKVGRLFLLSGFSAGCRGPPF